MEGDITRTLDIDLLHVIYFPSSGITGVSLAAWDSIFIIIGL